ncbi:hypothetical protein MMC07_001979 [Pseudocyphellaria aurata]|nr:hypothetical protein [Pseudocyphellaria aurata]
MQFFKAFVFASFMLAFTSAAPAPDADAAPAPVFDAEADAGLVELDTQLAKRSFGCPLHAQQCNDHVNHHSTLNPAVTGTIDG